jgi:hypothetical protein
MEVTHRNQTLVKLINEAANALIEVAAWPDSQINQETAEQAIKVLKKAWREESYPQALLYFSLMNIAHTVFGETINREGNKNKAGAGLHKAWMMAGELLSR